MKLEVRQEQLPKTEIFREEQRFDNQKLPKQLANIETKIIEKPIFLSETEILENRETKSISNSQSKSDAVVKDSNKFEISLNSENLYNRELSIADNNKKIITNAILKESTTKAEYVREVSVNQENGIKDKDIREQSRENSSRINSTSERQEKGNESSLSDNKDSSKNENRQESDVRQKVGDDSSFKASLKTVEPTRPLDVLPEQEIVKTSQKIIKSIEIIKELTKFIQSKEGNSLVLKLIPDNLGQVKVSLNYLENKMAVLIEVENSEVKALVEKNLNQLFTNLQQSGISSSSVKVAINSSTDGKNSRGNHNPKNKENGREFKSKFDKDIKVKSFGYNTYEYLV